MCSENNSICTKQMPVMLQHAKMTKTKLNGSQEKVKKLKLKQALTKEYYVILDLCQNFKEHIFKEIFNKFFHTEYLHTYTCTLFQLNFTTVLFAQIACMIFLTYVQLEFSSWKHFVQFHFGCEGVKSNIINIQRPGMCCCWCLAAK